MNELRVNGQRLWDSLMELAKIGATPKGGVKRLTLTDLDRQGRDLVTGWAREMGMTVTVDQIGNVFMRREGTNPSLPPVMTGSHIDTQPTGGKFDGNYGVLAGIEVVRTLGEDLSTILIAHDLDIVFGVCDRVAVLDLGRLIACDTPDAIKAHEGAQAAYLGASLGEAA